MCVDLATVRATVDADTDVPDDLEELPWPEPAAWLAALAESPLVGDDRPLHLMDSTLYLDRLWTDEQQVAQDLRERLATPAGGVDPILLASGLTRLFVGNDLPDFQRMAAAVAVLRSVSVVAGGPGTGKTTTVARVLALLDEQASAGGRRPPLIALAADSARQPPVSRRRCGLARGPWRSTKRCEGGWAP